MLYNTIKYNAIQYNIIQYKPYNALIVIQSTKAKCNRNAKHYPATLFIAIKCDNKRLNQHQYTGIFKHFNWSTINNGMNAYSNSTYSFILEFFNQAYN